MSIYKTKRNRKMKDDEVVYEIAGMVTPSAQTGPEELKKKASIINIRNEKVVVNIRAVFLKIGEIDTAKESFMAEIFIEAKWREPYFDGKKRTVDVTKLNWADIWTPQIYVANAVGELKETIWYEVLWNAAGEGVVVERRRLKGSLVENLELWNFPFDEQDLSITLISELPMREVEFVEDPLHPSCINKFAFIDEQEWHLFDSVYTTKRIIGKFYELSGKVNHHAIDFSCKTLRRSGFFVWNTFFVLFLLCAMTFTTFAVVYTKPENRLQLTFILLLTTVAFRTNVNNSLPKISYLTLMDKYIILSMVCQCVVCVWHAIVGGALHCTAPCNSNVPNEHIFWADKIVLIVLGALYIISNIIFFGWIYFGIVSKCKRLYKYESAYAKRLKTSNELGEHENTVYEEP